MRPVLLRFLVVVAALLISAVAHAEEGGAAKKHKPMEVGVFPLVGGSSDIGIGGGAAGALTHFAPGQDEYRWRLEASGIITYNPSGGLSHIPYTDVYVKYTVPDLGRGVRLELRPSYTHEATLRYYGFGNASVRDASLDKGTYNEFGRTHPTMEALVRLTLGGGFFVRFANYFTYNTLDVARGSLLEHDLASADPETRKLLGSTKSHAVDFFEYAVAYDTRDDELVTKSGQYHDVFLRYSPGGTGFFPYRYEQIEATARGYYTFKGDTVTLAGRVLGDVQLGNPPFYELARIEDTYALGGSKGVRGIPAQRYYGKLKILGNVEGRVHVLTFHALGKELGLSVAAFFDAGRLWADTHPHPDLDGTTFGLKFGTGGGVRLQEGKTFVVRLDLAWSPDAHPLGGYFGVGELF